MTNNNLITVGEVVRSYLNAKGTYDLNNYKRFIRIVKEGYTDLNIDFELVVDTIKETVSDLNLIELPAEYVDYLRIGMEMPDGSIFPLGRNDNLSYITRDSVGAIQISEKYKDAIELWEHTRITAPGGHNKANFKIDPNERMVIFEGDLRNQTIVVDYLSNKPISTESAIIDRRLLPVLKEYLNWTALRFSNNAPAYKVRDAEKQYYRAYHHYNMLRNKFTLDEMLDAVRQGQHQGLKL